MSQFDSLSRRALQSPESGIVAVVNHGRLKPGLIPLWAGESDEKTPDFISRPAADALLAGETFYTWQRGLPELRQALADYHARLFGRELPLDAFCVTGSGMQAIKIAIEAVTNPGDEVLQLTPAWPNFSAALGMSGGGSVAVPLDHVDGGWSLDPDRLAAAITPKTRAIFFNSPSNPTGWTATREDLVAVLDLARKHGLWIIADEIYTRFFYAGGRAPSFLDIMDDADRIIFVNTFSKNWSMTGWRIGWIVAPPSLIQVLENSVQYQTSGVAQFMQKGALAALEHGEDFVHSQIAKAAAARDLFCDALTGTNRVVTRKPDGAFYAFFRIDGISDTRAAAIDIVDRANVGLAPGTAFDAGGATFLRACFLRRHDHVEEAAGRLAAYISSL
ncbi:pyridoxal phosphate-dependent aminotransferase [Hoeflea sp. YIM 152468]|uniref:pyridoxal phosphate-dependent aminotransferase n=1 Tax=Hoeflea sp. YIM 152468 TaxID=3031759 RepID=UPI0023DACC09|nr:pyridoxal phosphate-dependent aminotransferase [Hoeflea sp. YIM 152468]MDF1608801.1 pyridoxal phosphate-dependent aminotransferase [Hoeflea sp. YIM 152468]